MAAFTIPVVGVVFSPLARERVFNRIRIIAVGPRYASAIQTAGSPRKDPIRVPETRVNHDVSAMRERKIGCSQPIRLELSVLF